METMMVIMGILGLLWLSELSSPSSGVYHNAKNDGDNINDDDNIKNNDDDGDDDDINNGINNIKKDNSVDATKQDSSRFRHVHAPDMFTLQCGGGAARIRKQYALRRAGVPSWDLIEALGP